MDKLKLCFLTTSLSTGGIEMYLLRFLHYLDLEKFEVTVVVRSVSTGELAEDYRALNVDLVSLPLGYLQPWRLWKLFRLYHKEQFDVVCDFNANFAGLPMFIGRKAGIEKRIAFYRQGKDHFQSSLIKNEYNKAMNRLVFRNSTHILANSYAAIEYFFPYRNEDDQRFQVVRNGVNVEEYQLTQSKMELRKELGLPVDAFIIGHVGRLDPAKNHSTILKVFRSVKQKIPEAHLVLCGKGTKTLHPEIQKWGRVSDASIWEYRTDIPRVLGSLDCFLFPSITEGQPNALIEAMVAGVPVVASDILPIKECMPKKAWEYLFHPNDVNQMASAVLKIHNHEPDVQYLREFSEKRFSATLNFKQFENLVISNE